MEQERKVVASKRGIVFEYGVVCYRCGVPQEICERWDNYSIQRESGTCQFYGVLIGVVYGVKHAYPEVWKWWFGRREHQVQTREQEMKYFGLIAKGRAVQCTWLLYAFCEMTGRLVEGE